MTFYCLAEDSLPPPFFNAQVGFEERTKRFFTQNIDKTTALY